MALTMTGWRAESADRKLMARVAPPWRSNALIFIVSCSLLHKPTLGASLESVLAAQEKSHSKLQTLQIGGFLILSIIWVYFSIRLIAPISIL